MSVCSYPLQTWGWRGWGQGGRRASVSGRAACVCAVTGWKQQSEAGAQIFYLLHCSRWDSLLVAYMSAPACVGRKEPGLSAFSKRNEPSELYVLRHNFASTLVCPVTCHYVTFPLVFPSLSEHERGCRWRWAEPLENLLRMAGARVRSGKHVFFCSVPEGEYWKPWKQN